MYPSYISDLVRASGVQQGEHVLIHFWGEDSDREIADAFLSAAAAAGAVPVLLQQSRTANYDLFRQAEENPFPDSYFDQFSQLDAVLDVFTYRPVILGQELDDKHMAFYRSYMRRLFRVLMNAKRFTQIRIPTQANAEESGLPPDEYIRRMEQAYSIDYEALRCRCQEKAAKLSTHTRFTLTTGDRCSAFFDTSGRQWYVDAGDGDWPCGEVYIAPLETKTHGSIFFPQLYLENAGFFTDVTLHIQYGKLTGSSHPNIDRFLQTLAPEDTVICELGFGMNPNITELCGYPLLDEKMYGSFHIAIGANHMFGGENRSEIHMDFVHSGQFAILPKL